MVWGARGKRVSGLCNRPFSAATTSPWSMLTGSLKQPCRRKRTYACLAMHSLTGAEPHTMQAGGNMPSFKDINPFNKFNLPFFSKGRWRWWCQRVPLVNLVYDLVFDEPPSVANVEKLLNVYGLVTALILASIQSIPGAVDVGELEEADRRYHEARLDGRCWYNEDNRNWDLYGGQFTHRMFYRYNMATVLISAALFCTVLVYMCFTSHDFDNDKPAFDRWWYYARWPITGIFCCLLAGARSTYVAFLMLCEVKWPIKCMRTEDSMDFEQGKYSGFDPYDMQHTGVYVALTITALFMSLAAWARYGEEAEKAAEEAMPLPSARITPMADVDMLPVSSSASQGRLPPRAQQDKPPHGSSGLPVKMI
jgi:hypothetical protein